MTTYQDICSHHYTTASNGLGTVSESSYYPGRPGYNALDGSSGPGNFWIANAVTGWWKIDLGSGFSEALVRYGITVPNTAPSPNRAPKDWTFQGSNDDSNWTVLDTVTGETGWSQGETRYFTFSNTTKYRYYRFNITANNGDASYLELGEVYLYREYTDTAATSFGSDVFTGGTISSESEYSSSYIDDYAFDNNDITRWSADKQTSWIKYDLGVGNANNIEKIRIKGYANAGVSGTGSFWVCGSNDDSDWTLLYSGAQVGNEDYQEHTFANSTDYRYWLLRLSSELVDASFYETEGLEGTITTVETPIILPVSGAYPANQSISMSCATSGASIYYTEDGSTPDSGDTLYTTPFTLGSAKTIKAIGIKAGLTDSDIDTAVYTIATIAPQPIITIMT